MVDVSHEFVADDLWLLVGVVTFGAVSLLAVLGGGALVSVVAVLGWFVITPILLFFGEEVADALVGPPEEEAETERSEDPIETLKREYAAGRVDEETFERRLERLLETEDDGEDTATDRSREREDLLERE
jgi:uncharacterized membrane protein